MYNQITANKRKSIFLITIFIVIVIFLGYALGQYTGYGYNGLVIAVIVSIVMSLTSYFSGDKVALATAGAKGPISESDNAYVYRMVENLCITAGMPMPKVYIIHDPSLNAFATGRDPEHASIALTTGIIKHLENEELEGVIAHELSHIKNYDIRVMTIVIILVGVVTLLADFFLRYNIFGGRGDNRSSNGNIIMLVGLILAILSPIFATLIQLAVSRKREYLADASGALLTRYPDGLANALRKIQHHSSLARANHATAHLFIANPFARKNISKLFATHPPIEDRIAQLESMT